MRALDIHRHALTPATRRSALSEHQLQGLDDAGLAEYAADVEAHVAGLLLSWPAREDMAEQMTRLVRVNRHKRPGANTIIALTGHNGVGKSTFAREWVTSFYCSHLHDLEESAASIEELPRWHPAPGHSATLVPVVWLSPVGETAKTSFQGEIARFLGYSGARAAASALSLLGRHGVRLLVVDDCHFLRTQNAWGRAMLDTLKTANNELGEHGGTLMLIGADLDGGDLFADPQIGRRLAVHHLSPFGIDTRADQQTWQRLLKTTETHLAPYLPASQPGFLFRHAPVLWRHTQGYLRDLHELLTEATTAAVLSRTWTITPDSLVDGTVSLRAVEERRARDRRHARERKTARRTREAAGA